MGENHTEGKKKQWSKITPERRSIEMSRRVKKGWATKSKKERLAQGRKLVEARLAKRARVIPS